MGKKSTIDDVIGALEDAMTAAESIAKSKEDGPGSKGAAIDAINQIRRGEYADAITTLEREFLPKWEDTASCAAAYRTAMKPDTPA